MMHTGKIRSSCGNSLVVFVLFAAAAWAQESSDPVQKAMDLGLQTGPAVADYGPVFTIDPDHVAFAPSLDTELKAVFEISIGAEGRDKEDVSIMNVARFVNMHARAGMSKDKLKAAIVMHGGGTWEVLNNEAYRQRFGIDTPTCWRSKSSPLQGSTSMSARRARRVARSCGRSSLRRPSRWPFRR
jgi:hypothetical protein